MKTTHTTYALAALALLSTLNPQLSTVFAQGSLTPPGAPAPTMKSLDQIEARTAITNTASLVTISQPGSYYLTHNLTVSSGDGIDINTNGVTLDLNGFTISSTAASATGTGILLNSRLSDITIFNGHIRGGVTNNGSGVYSGSGFAIGIYYSGSSPANVIVSRVTVSGCLSYGINLAVSDTTLVDSCVVQTVGSAGIYANNIRSSTALDCGGNAIYGAVVSGCYGACSGNGDGVHGNLVQNCTGISAGIGYGVIANYTAHDCYGSSQSGYGVYADTALNCYGYSPGSGTGLRANQVANTCYGTSSSGTGLSAYIANSCRGTSTSGTAQSISYKYNMP